MPCEAPVMIATFIRPGGPDAVSMWVEVRETYSPAGVSGERP